MNVLDYISEEQQDFFGEIMKEDMADQIAGNKCKCMTDDDETEIDCNKCSGMLVILGSIPDGSVKAENITIFLKFYIKLLYVSYIISR